MLSTFNVEDIAARLKEHQPRTTATEKSGRHAAVALVLAPGMSGPEALLVRRAEREDDPWSGHMAFPGGRSSAADESLEHAARRETWEETGLLLPPDACMGRLHDVGGGRLAEQGLALASFVYALDTRPTLHLNHELAAAVWIPLHFLAKRENLIHYHFPPDPWQRDFPAYVYAGYIIWGITQRILANFFALYGHDLPRDPFLQDVE
jgi:8-oxo-dGTP pyrophosphatase MutT (NUDIX family)